MKTLNEFDTNIVYGIAHGHGTKQIADRMQLTEREVETHRIRIMRQNKCRNGPHLVHWAYQNGILKVGEGVLT